MTHSRYSWPEHALLYHQSKAVDHRTSPFRFLEVPPLPKSEIRSIHSPPPIVSMTRPRSTGTMARFGSLGLFAAASSSALKVDFSSFAITILIFASVFSPACETNLFAWFDTVGEAACKEIRHLSLQRKLDTSDVPTMDRVRARLSDEAIVVYTFFAFRGGTELAEIREIY